MKAPHYMLVMAKDVNLDFIRSRIQYIALQHSLKVAPDSAEFLLIALQTFLSNVLHSCVPKSNVLSLDDLVQPLHSFDSSLHEKVLLRL